MVDAPILPPPPVLVLLPAVPLMPRFTAAAAAAAAAAGGRGWKGIMLVRVDMTVPARPPATPPGPAPLLLALAPAVPAAAAGRPLTAGSVPPSPPGPRLFRKLGATEHDGATGKERKIRSQQSQHG